MDAVTGRVRIGEVWYALAEGYYDEIGLRPMRVVWDSLFAPRQGSPGAPGYQNLREDDLRWMVDSWRGGEGQAVIDPTDEESFRRWASADGLDLSSPGQLRLGYALIPEGLTGAAQTTREGAAPDASSGGSDEGTDRRLSADGNWARYNLVLSPGTWSVRMYAYEAPAPSLALSQFVEVIPVATYHAASGAIRLRNEGARTRSLNRSPGPSDVAVTFTISAPEDSRGTVTCKVVRIDTGSVVAQKALEVRSGRQGAASVTYNAKDGVTYRYWFTATNLVGTRLDLTEVREDVRRPRQIDWEITDPSDAVVASGTFDTLDVTEPERMATAEFAASAGTYKLRYTRTSAPRAVYIDKTVYSVIGLKDPRLLELGLGGRVWLVDRDASSSPAVAYWQDDHWQVVGTFGPVGLRGVALAHSDRWEYIGASNGIVYRASTTAVEAATTAISDTLVGCAVGGNRLFILGESATGGTKLYDHALDGTPGAPTERYAVGNVGVSVEDEFPQRIAGTASGAVFFTNSGPDAWVYTWDGQAGRPIKRLATGFRATAICHALGVTWVAGEFVRDQGRRRPAIFAIDQDAAGAPAEQLPVRLHREGDTSGRIFALQQYGTDLWVLARAAPGPVMRVWRISLSGVPAAFVEHEVEQPSGDPRGLAVTWAEVFATWSSGSPLRRAQDHVRSGTWRSSLYTFRLSEPKVLLAAAVAGDFPGGTSVRLRYALDGGPAELAGRFTAPGEVLISTPAQTEVFRTLGLEAELRTSDPAVTPTVHYIDVRATTAEYRRQVELLLRCTDPDVAGVRGQRVSAAEAIANIFTLAGAGRLVEYEDRYSDPERSQVYHVLVDEPDAFYMAPGEALVRVRLRIYGAP